MTGRRKAGSSLRSGLIRELFSFPDQILHRISGVTDERSVVTILFFSIEHQQAVQRRDISDTVGDLCCHSAQFQVDLRDHVPQIQEQLSVPRV